MPNQHDYDQSVMNEALPNITVPLLIAPTAIATIRGSNQDLLLQDLQRLMEEERLKEEKRIQLLKQKQHNIGEQVNKRLAAKDRKLRQLEEEQTKRVFSQCTFKPKTISKGGARSLKEFLEQQSDFTRKIEQKRATLKQNMQVQKDNKNTFQPKTNSRVQQRKKEGTVFDRLYALKDKQNDDDGNSRLSEDFHPKITEKGKKLSRNGPVEDHLYKDALRRQQKAKEVSHNQNTAVAFAGRGVNLNNQKYVAQKFIKQYYAVIQRLNVPSSTSAKIDYMLFNQILKEMGFVQVEEESESSHQRTLIHQAYQLLEAFQVNAKNICVFLLALIGVFHINPVNFQEGENSQPQQQLALDQSEGRKIQKNFDLFKRNRLFSQNGRRQIVQQGPSYSFKPQTNKSSDEMAERYRDQMLQQVNQVLQLHPEIDFNVPKDGVITPTDLLVMYNKAKQIKKQYRKQEMKQHELQSCTFKPATLHSSQAMGSSKWSSADGHLGQKKSIQLYNYHRELQSKKESLRVSRQSQDITMKECTFAPNMRRSKVPQSDTSKFKTKEVEETLYRMKKGRQLLESKKKYMQRGEPSSLKKDQKYYSVDSKLVQKQCEESEETPILLLDVNLGNRVQRLTLFNGDEERLEEVAKEFALRHELDEESEARLFQLLEVQMENMLAKIPEDQQSEDNVQE